MTFISGGGEIVFIYNCFARMIVVFALLLYYLRGGCLLLTFSFLKEHFND